MSGVDPTYSIMTGYWDAELKRYSDAQKAKRAGHGGFRVMEQIKEPAPSTESEHPKNYTPSETEVQHGIDLVRIVMETGKKR